MTTPTRLRAALGALALALAALALPGSGTAAAQDGTAVPGRYCTVWDSHYSGDRYTFLDERMCLDINSESLINVYLETARNTYYWKGAWYSAAEAYPANFDLEGDVYSGEHLFHFAPSSKLTARSQSKQLVTGGIFKKCGTFVVKSDYHQAGAYRMVSSIDVDQRARSVDVPCALSSENGDAGGVGY
ncbi:hypothetical protein [Streptomyces sp. NPDC093589]|uniref:hypothetical protein n=1 Tax=Streptomyces sp. NPDC093589 TaxID=3366043 RepID=UPI00382D374E